MNRLLGMLGLFLLLATSASATVTTYVTTLSGANESPTNGSSASGSATLVIDTSVNSADLTVTFSGLSATATAAHMHCCVAPPTNAIVAIGSTGFPFALSGTFSKIYDLLDPTIYNSAFVSANGGTTAGAMAAFLTGLTNGQGYYNIHDSQFPGGEIRGYFAVPEPGTAVLLLGGLALLASRRRREAVSR